MKKQVSFFLALSLCLSMTACGMGKQENQKQDEGQSVTQTEEKVQEQDGEEKRTITDVTGNTFEVPKNLERVVAFSPGDCEIIYALGAGNLLVGRGEYCNYPKEAEAVPSVQSGAEINAEQIIALNPQVVVMSKLDTSQEQVAAIEKAGIPVCLDTETDIEGAYGSIRVLGELLGREEQAEAMVAEMKNTFAQLQEKSKEQEGGSVYFEVSPLEYGLWTTGSDTFMNEIAENLGLTNIFEDVSGWAEISEEQVIERNPDYIVTVTMYYGEGPTPEEEIMGRTGWQDITAVKNKKVYNANSDEISRPGPRLADAAEMLYGFIYEEK